LKELGIMAKEIQDPDEYVYSQSVSNVLKSSRLRLDGSNYTAWRAQVDVLLDLQDLEDVVKELGDLED
jgi:hypothetical protein